VPGDAFAGPLALSEVGSATTPVEATAADEEEEKEEEDCVVGLAGLSQLPRLSRLELSDWPMQVRSDLEVPEPPPYTLTHSHAHTHWPSHVRSLCSRCMVWLFGGWVGYLWVGGLVGGWASVAGVGVCFSLPLPASLPPSLPLPLSIPL
jgi:hypothetical protein